MMASNASTTAEPAEQGGDHKSDAGRERIDDEILQPRMPSRHEELQQFQHTDQRDGHDHRQPVPRIGEAKGKPDQHESQRMLAILPEIGVRPVARRTERCEGDGGGKQPGKCAEQQGCHERALARFAAPMRASPSENFV